MVVSYLHNKSLHTQTSLLKELAAAYPGLHFKPGHHYAWSAKTNTVSYKNAGAGETEDMAALIHEVAHADLAHSNFDDDFALLQLEVAAWQRAKVLAGEYGVHLDEDYIQDCLDTYRDWLHARAKCPTCGVVSLQAKGGIYTCFNCKTAWKVPKSQLCRVRRTVVRS
jgi:ribosomal protein L37AE/L43A